MRILGSKTSEFLCDYDNVMQSSVKSEKKIFEVGEASRAGFSSTKKKKLKKTKKGKK